MKVKHISHLSHANTALRLLTCIHNKFYPIIERRGYNVLSLLEICCCGDGLDYDKSKKTKSQLDAYVEESGGVVKPETELSDEDLADGAIPPREVEANRPELLDTLLEAIDVHITGNNGAYTGTLINTGGSGRVLVAMSVALLWPGADATVNGFCLSGGALRADIKTNIHHVAQGTTSQQNQQNMIGGRAIGAFRGRIRVEQSAQQRNSSQQLLDSSEQPSEGVGGSILGDHCG